jgi:hypothetical protein
MALPVVGQQMIGVQLADDGGDGGLRPGPPASGVGTGGETQNAILADIVRRLANLEGAIRLKVDGDRVLSQILLTKEAVLIAGDKIGIAGEVTFADWHRNVSGNPIGGGESVAPSITRIRGGVIQTERIQNFSGSAYIDLDAVGATEFIRCGTGVSIQASGAFTFGGAGGKALIWDGVNLNVGTNALVAGTPAGEVASEAHFGATRSVGDITTSILANSATSIRMRSSALFKSTDGLGGVFIGAGGIFGRNSVGNPTFAIDGATGDAAFMGDIDTNGFGRFNGQTVSSLGTVAVLANTSNGSSVGVGGLGTTGQVGVWGRNSSATGWGVVAENTGGGPALEVRGPLRITTSGVVPNLNASFVRGFGTEIITYLGSTTSSGTIVGYINVRTIGGSTGKLALYS